MKLIKKKMESLVFQGKGNLLRHTTSHDVSNFASRHKLTNQNYPLSLVVPFSRNSGVIPSISHAGPDRMVRRTLGNSIRVLGGGRGSGDDKVRSQSGRRDDMSRSIVARPGRVARIILHL